MVCKTFFLLRISGSSGKVVKKRRGREAITKRFALEANAKNMQSLLKVTHFN